MEKIHPETLLNYIRKIPGSYLGQARYFAIFPRPPTHISG